MVTKPQTPVVLRAIAAHGMHINWQERADIINRCADLEELVTAIGAQQNEKGEWVMPYYMANGNHLMLRVDEWIGKRKEAAGKLAAADGQS